MPLIEFQCKTHGLFTRMFSLNQEYQAKCPICQKAAIRKFSPPLIRMGFRSGWDTQAGEYFDTQRQRDNWLSEKGYEAHYD